METDKALILRMHPGMGWDEDHKVRLHKFQKVVN